jgi:hypothetical protein
MGDQEELADVLAAREARESIDAGEPLIPWEKVKVKAEASDAELAALRHQGHLMMGDQGRCGENCTHEPYPPCPICGEPA